MTVRLITKDQDGFHTYTGRVMSRDEHALILLLTRPFEETGYSVRLEVGEIVDELVLAA